VSSVRFVPVLLVAVLGLAACQPLPQPFRPEVKGARVSPLALPIGESSVFVRPIEGLPEDQGRLMAEAIAAALDDQEVPATAAYRNPLSADLVIAFEGSRGSNPATWRWHLDKAGTAARTGQAQPLRSALEKAAASADPGDRKQLAEAMAAVIGPALQPDVPESLFGSDGKKLAVLECDGAPGDGNKSLRQAMREQLILANRAPVADPARADYLIACSVKVWSDSPDSERVTIEWALLGTDGGKLGQVKQANRIPKGQLDGVWGRTAHIIAQGGWSGITEILDRQRRTAAPSPGLAAPPSGKPPKS
jgi:hypothetical protein